MGRMTVYTVHEPPAPPADRIDRAEAMVFLKETFNWPAFLLGPIWLLANRLWLPLVGYLAAAVAIGALLESLDAEPTWNLVASLALNAIVAYEAHALRVAKLTSGGWTMAGTVVGRSIADCERRFFDHWLPSQPVLRRPDAAPAAVTPSATMTEQPARKTGGGRAASPAKRRLFGLFRRRE